MAGNLAACRTRVEPLAAAPLAAVAAILDVTPVVDLATAVAGRGAALAAAASAGGREAAEDPHRERGHLVARDEDVRPVERGVEAHPAGDPRPSSAGSG